MTDWTDFIIPVIAAIVATFGTTSFIFKIRYKRTDIKNSQFADNNAVNIQHVSNSQIHIQTNPLQPMQSNLSTKSHSDQPVRDLLKRIGKEKISTLLQEATLIARDAKDQEMSKWIERELNGYVPPSPKSLTRKEAKETGLLPDYRDVNGEFDVMGSDGITSMKYPILMGHDIKQIENLIERLKKGGAVVTIEHTFPSNTPLIGGQSGNLEIPLVALEGIVNGAERKLSKYLESKLTH